MSPTFFPGRVSVSHNFTKIREKCLLTDLFAYLLKHMFSVCLSTIIRDFILQ